MADVVVTNDVDTFLRSADNAAARTNLEVYSDAEVDAKVATKAVAGGVELVNATLSISNGPVIGTSDFSIVFKVNFNTSVQSQGIFSSFVGSSEARGITVFTGSSPAGQLIFRLFGATSGDRIQAQVNNFINTYGGTDRTIAFVRSGSALQIIVDGVEIPFVESTTGTSPTWGGSIDSNDWRLLAAAVSSNSATLRGSWFFNRALSAAEVADLYESGTVAVADRWGGKTGLMGSVATNSDVDLSTFTATGSATVSSQTATGFTGLSIPTPITTGISDASDGLHADSANLVDASNLIKLSFTISNFSGTGDVVVGFSGQNYPSTGAVLLGGNGDYVVYLDNTANNANARIKWVAVGGTADFDLSNFTVERAGCIADLPLDEGIGYQFHDRSSNHYDALASTTGVTHLVPKTEGYIRDFNVDAYNGGSGNTELVDGSRDILPFGAFPTFIMTANRNTAAITGTLDVKKSNGGSGQVTGSQVSLNMWAATSNIVYYLNTFPLTFDDAPNASTDRQNIAVTASDADATDLDIRVDYKIIE